MVHDFPLLPRAHAAAGAVMSVLLQRLCAAAGRPLLRTGTEAAMLFALERPESGESFQRVQAWLNRSITRFTEVGIRVAHRWAVHKPEAAGQWVAAGRARRAVLLAVDGTVLHPTRKLRPDTPHALGIYTNPRGAPVLLDAFADPTERVLDEVSPELDRAAALAKYNALEMFWVGWS